MQGELQTSHAYVIGGDIQNNSPLYKQGYLGAEFKYSIKKQCYIIQHILKGDIHIHSPLRTPGIELKTGDAIYKIDGEKLKNNYLPLSYLINKSAKEISLEISRKNTNYKKNNIIFIKTLKSETNIRYTDWVEKNKNYINKKSNKKIGYIHIPNMEESGYSKFINSFLQECNKKALIIDIRFNNGGNISSLILEKLSRKRLGHDISRWNGKINYPSESTTGIMLCLINEFTASDGDMFAHSFKLLKLGPLIGKRTWGGVIGIEPRHYLIDKGYTTHPEFSFWFKDVGFNIENYGVQPDIEINNTTSSYEKGKDLQLEYALKKIKKMQIKKKEK